MRILVRSAYLCTGHLGEYMKNGAMLFDEEDARIVAVGEYDSLSKKEHDKEIGGTSFILLPGFVNTHTHSIQTALRGKADDLALLDWLETVILPGEAGLSEEDARQSSFWGFEEMLVSGTTTCHDMLTTRHAEASLEVAEKIGIRARIGKMLMDTGNAPPGMLDDTETALRETEELLSKWHNRDGGRIKYTLNPRFLLSCTDELMEGLVEIQTRNPDVLLHTHAAENKLECKAVEEMYGMSYIEKLHELGFLGPKTVLAHGVWLSDSDKKLLAETNTAISHNPSANCKLASGVADVMGMMELGIRIGLATDGPPCNNKISMLDEMRLATFLQKVSSLNETALPASGAFFMATLGGAAVLNLDEQIGSLEPGKLADFVLLDIDKPNARPLYNPLSHLVYAANAGDVNQTWVNGCLVAECGKSVFQLE